MADGKDGDIPHQHKQHRGDAHAGSDGTDGKHLSRRKRHLHGEELRLRVRRREHEECAHGLGGGVLRKRGSTWSSTPPKWLTAFTKQDGGSTSAKSYTVTVAAQTSTTTNPHTAALRKAAQVTNYDLSTKGNTTKANTANCYIVNAPGSYRLPLVYGNAIKNGDTNSSAYISTKGGEGVLSSFIDHSGQQIIAPNIYDRYQVHSCTLLWQDEKNLVTNVRLLFRQTLP